MITKTKNKCLHCNMTDESLICPSCLDKYQSSLSLSSDNAKIYPILEDYPTSLRNSLQNFKHDFRYASNLSSVDFNYVVKQYFSHNKLPSFTFTPFSLVEKNNQGSCYDLSLLAYHRLVEAGYKADLLHFGWTAREDTSLGVLSCLHMVCRFWEDNQWKVFQGCLYNLPVDIWGPFDSLEKFIDYATRLIKNESQRDIKINFIDVLSFENKRTPSRIHRVYPENKLETDLAYWVI